MKFFICETRQDTIRKDDSFHSRFSLLHSCRPTSGMGPRAQSPSNDPNYVPGRRFLGMISVQSKRPGTEPPCGKAFDPNMGSPFVTVGHLKHHCQKPPFGGFE